jgi:serine O-acetyltransferase
MHHSRGKWGIEIQPDAQIGPGFYIFHYGGIFIGGAVVAGENLTLTHDTTIGYSRAQCRRGCPTFGNNVWIAPGAKIAGRITVGSSVNLGANVVIERNVPDNAVVQLRSPLAVTFPTQDGA